MVLPHLRVMLHAQYLVGKPVGYLIVEVCSYRFAMLPLFVELPAPP